LQLSEHARGMATLKGRPTVAFAGSSRDTVHRVPTWTWRFMYFRALWLFNWVSFIQTTGFRLQTWTRPIRLPMPIDGAQVPGRQQELAPTKNIKIPGH